MNSRNPPVEAQLAHCQHQTAKLVRVCGWALQVMSLIDDADLIPVEKALRAAIQTAAPPRTARVSGLLAAYGQAWSGLPEETHARLARAIDLALGGNVTFTKDGASIRSQNNGNQYYCINGCACTCPDEWAPLVAGAKACKHQMSVWLELKAQRLEEDS